MAAKAPRTTGDANPPPPYPAAVDVSRATVDLVLYIFDRNDRECHETRSAEARRGGLGVAGRAARGLGADRCADRQAVAARVVRGSRDERGDAVGDGAEARASDPERALLCPQPHA